MRLPDRYIDHCVISKFQHERFDGGSSRRDRFDAVIAAEPQIQMNRQIAFLDIRHVFKFTGGGFCKIFFHLPDDPHPALCFEI